MAIHLTWQESTEAAAAGAYGMSGRRVATRKGTMPSEVRRTVEAPLRTLELVGLLGQVPAGEAKLEFRGTVERRYESAASRTYRALLRYPGVFGPTHRVEVDVVSYAPALAALSIRSAEPLGRRVNAARYEQAIEAALDSIARLLPWQASTSAAAEAAVLAEAGAVLEAARATAVADAVADDERAA